MNELKIDKDCFVDQDWIESYIKVIVDICSKRGITAESIKMCNSKKKGLHFYVKINPPIEPSLANQLQWLLGDDSQRVDFNRARIESGLVEWNKLFEVASRRLKTIYSVNGEQDYGRRSLHGKPGVPTYLEK